MVGLDVGDKTLLSRKDLDQLASTHGPVNDFIYAVAKYLIDLSAQFGWPGTPMYDPLSHLVYVTRGDDVQTTIVSGKVLMRNRLLPRVSRS